jgi:SAM-dependent methyltransferase
MIVDIQKVAIDFVSKNVDLKAKKILEIGSDIEGDVAEYLATHFDAEITATNTSSQFKINSSNPKIKFLRSDCRDIPFPDNYFDVIFSVNTFEHVNYLPLALREMFRVLKKGGQLGTYFGPLFSCSKGHHLWAKYKEDIVSYWNPKHRNPLDDFDHLLLSPQQLREKLKNKNEEPGMIEAIIDAVYRRDDINRLMYNDYLTLFKESPFHRRVFEQNEIEISASVYESLKQIWGDNHFSVTSLRLILEKLS